MTKQDLFLEGKDNLKEICGDGIPLMLTVLMSISWLWYSTHRVARCYPLEETAEGYLGSFCIISINCLWIWNDLKTNCVIKASVAAGSNATQSFISKRSPLLWKTECHGGWLLGVKETSTLWTTQSECKTKYKNTFKKLLWMLDLEDNGITRLKLPN